MRVRLRAAAFPSNKVNSAFHPAGVGKSSYRGHGEKTPTKTIQAVAIAGTVKITHYQNLALLITNVALDVSLYSQLNALVSCR